MATSLKTTLSSVKAANQRGLRKSLEACLADLTSLKTQFNQLRTDFNAHVHGGITAGAANSSAPTATSATAVTLDFTS